MKTQLLPSYPPAALLLATILLVQVHGQEKTAPTLRIDPLLIAQAGEVWSILAKPDNPLWPGWTTADTPLLFYLPQVQDVLINHPSPPAGFRRYSGPLGWPGARIDIRDGRTFFEYDGQNTILDVDGIPTLVVADTLSNRRLQIQSWLGDPRSASAKSAELTWDQLQGSPYDSICMIAHEAFHAYQRKVAPHKGGSEEALTRYPTTLAANTLGFALEGELLARAIRAEQPSQTRSLALRWLAVRMERRKGLTPQATDYEDRMEYLEGLAKYVEYRLLEVLQGRTPGPAMSWAQGFRGYDDLKPQREALLTKLTRMMSGQANVNNDPYGASPLRMRLYFSGMACAILLDRLSPDWKQQIFQPQATLTSLLTRALDPSQQDLSKELAIVRSDPDYATLLARKQQLQRDAQEAVEKARLEIEQGPHTRLIVDYSRLGETRPGLSFTPFGILRVDDDRTIYRLVPITAKVGETLMRQSAASPLLHNRSGKQLTCQLQESISTPQLESLLAKQPHRGEAVVLTDLKLPGVTIHGGSALVGIKDKLITLSLLPASEK